MATPGSAGQQTPEVRVGTACTELIARPKSWINRRVETTELLSHEETRRRVSIDFTLSEGHLEELELPDGVVVPISVLTKQPRRNFDLRDESGRSLPVLGKEQNGQLAYAALLNAVWDAIGEDVTAEVFELLAADLAHVVFEPPDAADEALSFFAWSARGDQWRTAILDDPTCWSLLDVLRANYVLFAVLAPGGPNRRVLKFSYGDEPPRKPPFRARWHPLVVAHRIWRPDRQPFLIQYPMAWRAQSFHAEIAIAEELRFDMAVLFNEVSEEFLAEDTDVNRAALYASEELDEEQSTVCLAEVAPERVGRPLQAALTGLAVAGLLWLGVASGLDATNPGPAASILLAGAALFSGVAASQGRHRIATTTFAATRRWLTLVSLAALAASATLALQYPDKSPIGVWRIAAIACTVAAARLAWSAVRAPS